MGTRRAIIALACSLCLSSVGWTQTLALPASADTTLWERSSDFNLGAENELIAGTIGTSQGAKRSRILFQFTIADQLPAGASIDSAKIQITVVTIPAGAADSTFAIHRVLQPWTEGTAATDDLPGGRMATVGETTWDARSHDQTEWSISGGALGEDFASEVSGTVMIEGEGLYEINFNARGLADLEDMRTTPAANFGWILLSQSEGTPKTARRFAARENSSDVPSLNINYTLPGPFEVPVLDQRFDRASEEVVITISTEPEATYMLERTLGLVQPSWIFIEEATGGLSGTLEMRGSVADLNAAFYRIIGTAAAP